jgi:glycine/D-amino acid oxidase-like deaminating enzyme
LVRLHSSHVVICGAGIIGASLAYHLAKRGARVTILESEQPGAGASGKSFGWLNATFSKRPRSYFDFSMLGIAGWHRLEQELEGDLQIQWGGSVCWSPPGPEAEQLRQDVAHHRNWGYGARPVDEAELRRLLPKVSPGPVAAGCHCEPEGAVDPIHALSVLLERAREKGAEVRFPSGVTGFDLTAGRVRAVQTSAGSIVVDCVVLACGVNSPSLAQLTGVDIPLKAAPGVLVHTAPQPPLIDRIVQAPGVHMRQKLDGRIIIGGQVVAGAGTASAGIADSEQIFRRATAILPSLNHAAIEQTTLGYRVMPADEYPILGFTEQCPNLYVAATHSGVTLAPVIGELAAIEILDGTPQPQLAPYRPSHFA